MSRSGQLAELAVGAIAVGDFLFRSCAHAPPSADSASPYTPSVAKVPTQSVPRAPLITAVAKGPNQIHLAWPALQGNHYSYLVEVRSESDARYPAWIELPPIAKASGYTCNNAVVYQGGKCSISDPAGVEVST
jgi:hypothetical protein